MRSWIRMRGLSRHLSRPCGRGSVHTSSGLTRRGAFQSLRCFSNEESQGHEGRRTLQACSVKPQEVDSSYKDLQRLLHPDRHVAGTEETEGPERSVARPERRSNESWPILIQPT
eukprot:g2935.t1